MSGALEERREADDAKSYSSIRDEETCCPSWSVGRWVGFKRTDAAPGLQYHEHEGQRIPTTRIGSSCSAKLISIILDHVGGGEDLENINKVDLNLCGVWSAVRLRQNPTSLHICHFVLWGKAFWRVRVGLMSTVECRADFLTEGGGISRLGKGL